MVNRRNRRPRILVTGPDRGGFAAWFFSALAIVLSGGIPKRVTPARSEHIHPHQGLVIGGGADVYPGWYSEGILEQISHDEPTRRLPLGRIIRGVLVYLLRILTIPKSAPAFDHPRDELEMQLIKSAIASGIPVLGICRGAQLLNIFLGGSLFQDLSDFYRETPQIRTIMPRKPVLISEGSMLHRIVGGTTIFVNSLHKQSVRKLGAGLRVNAKEPNGVVQGIEAGPPLSLLGVQWHPEYLWYIPAHLSLFRWLVETANSQIRTKPNGGADLEQLTQCCRDEIDQALQRYTARSKRQMNTGI